MMAATDVIPMAELTENLVTSFKMTLNNNDGNVVVNNDDELEVDVENLNALSLVYGLTKPNDLDIAPGSTYVINLPTVYGGSNVSGRPITIEGTQVATFDIVDGQIIITFNDEVNNFDNIEMFVNVSGTFNKEVFDEPEEVVVEVPYKGEGSYTATLRPERKEYEGQDRKDAGN